MGIFAKFLYSLRHCMVKIMSEGIVYDSSLENKVTDLVESMEVYIDATEGIPYIEILPIQWSLYANTKELAKEIMVNYSPILGNYLIAVATALAECNREWLRISVTSLKMMLDIRYQLYGIES